MIPEQPIRPLQDVWLRPRRVFRELASQPVGKTDYLLGAAQGVVSLLAWSRTQDAGAKSTVFEILGRAFVFGSIAGIASLFLMGAIYARLGTTTGVGSTRSRVFHVLAYGGVPMVVALGVWLVTALLAGETTFLKVPGPDTEGFVALLLQAQFIAYIALALWSVVLQVMGLSEINGLATRRALGIWLLGQVIGVLAMVFLAIVIAILLPNAMAT